MATRQSNKPPTSTLHDTPDWDLVTAATAGDRDATAELWKRHRHHVASLVRSYHVGEGNVEDITSDVFVRMIRALNAGTINQQGSNFGAWLCTVARNLVYDHCKSSRVKTTNWWLTTDTAVIGDRRVHQPWKTPNPDNVVADRDITRIAAQEINASMVMLTPDQRECLMLRFFEELSIAETAEAMGRNTPAVKALQHRASRRLAALLCDHRRSSYCRACDTGNRDHLKATKVRLAGEL